MDMVVEAVKDSGPTVVLAVLIWVRMEYTAWSLRRAISETNARLDAVLRPTKELTP